MGLEAGLQARAGRGFSPPTCMVLYSSHLVYTKAQWCSVTHAAGLSWHPDTPQQVKAVAGGAHQFLLEAADGYPKASSYFSASIKAGLQGMLQLYPHNYACDLLNSSTCYSCGSVGAAKGDNVPMHENNDKAGGGGCRQSGGSYGDGKRTVVPGFGDYNTLTGVEGVMEQHEFEEKLQGRCMGMPVPRKDPGRNCGECVFPFWDSPGLTDSARMLALLKMQLILEGDLTSED